MECNLVVGDTEIDRNLDVWNPKTELNFYPEKKKLNIYGLFKD